MQMLQNLKVSAKLSVLIGILSILLCVVSVMGYFFLRQSDDRLTKMYHDQLLPVKWLIETSYQVKAIDADAFELMLTTDQARKNQISQDMRQRAGIMNQNLENFEKESLDETEKQKLQELKIALAGARDARKGMLDLVKEGKGAEAYVYYVQYEEGPAQNFQKILSDIVEHSVEKAKKMDVKGNEDFSLAVNLLIAITLGAILLGIIVGILISRMITRPLQVIVGTSRKVAAGNLADVNMEISSKDEIGQLAQEFNSMTQNLRQLIKKVAETSEQVAASSEQLTASADESAQATNQVVGAVNEVATDAENQVKALEEISAVLEQMSAGVQQVAANSNTAAAETSQTVQTAEAGSAIVENAVSQMANIEKTVIDSAGVVVKLGERSGQIGQIVDTISGLAAQTNLLALNAAIEAARAGEQGRGFAVVAEEVRKLAEQSQEAAKQIAALISEVQAETSQAVQAMNNGTNEVKLGADTINQAGISFKEIVSLVQRVSVQVRDISAAIQQMAGGSQTIVASVKEADEISKNTSSQAQTVSAATQEQSASIEEIAAASQSLAKMAEELQITIRAFKI